MSFMRAVTSFSISSASERACNKVKVVTYTKKLTRVNLLTHIFDPLPVICPALGLDGASSKELVVLGSPHPEVLHELDSVIPLLVSVGPEQFSNVG